MCFFVSQMYFWIVSAAQYLYDIIVIKLNFF